MLKLPLAMHCCIGSYTFSVKPSIGIGETLLLPSTESEALSSGKEMVGITKIYYTEVLCEMKCVLIIYGVRYYVSEINRDLARSIISEISIDMNSFNKTTKT